MFILLNSCYSRSLANVFSRWDGNAVSVPSKIRYLTFANISAKIFHNTSNFLPLARSCYQTRAVISTMSMSVSAVLFSAAVALFCHEILRFSKMCSGSFDCFVSFKNLSAYL